MQNLMQVIKGCFTAYVEVQQYVNKMVTHQMNWLAFCSVER